MKDWPAVCAAVIPCFNEEATLPALIPAVRRHVPAVFVVDDGSGDRTAAVAGEAGAEVLCHPANLGKGAALQTGWQCAHRRGFAWALCLDGDGQHSPDNIPAFFHCADRYSAALVVGDRMSQATAMPWLRRVVNTWMSRRLSTAAGMSLPDTQCGFRLINLETWSHLRLTTSHFEIESEVLLAFVAAGCGVQFVPIRVIYKQEQSKIHPLRDAFRWMRWWKRVTQKPRA
ncbi:MAG TPA: glycosyltransferase family 2 protein [Dongiaceae bacterium]|nr:Glycosyl transferase family 2 [Verrucomicrobiota bacterium]HXP59833.1 glycosyltransferase family 2 protein [Dongiaceae bacterium]